MVQSHVTQVTPKSERWGARCLGGGGSLVSSQPRAGQGHPGATCELIRVRAAEVPVRAWEGPPWLDPQAQGDTLLCRFHHLSTFVSLTWNTRY